MFEEMVSCCTTVFGVTKIEMEKVMKYSFTLHTPKFLGLINEEGKLSCLIKDQ